MRHLGLRLSGESEECKEPATNFEDAIEMYESRERDKVGNELLQDLS